MADRLQFGAAEVSNAVFLVMPDEDLYIKRYKCQLDGLIGLPVLLKLEDITFHRNGQGDIHKDELSTGEPNLFLSGLKPFICGKVKGKECTSAFDSGANATMLYVPFFREFRKEADASGFPAKSEMAGVAGVRISSAYTMMDLAIEFAGRKAVFPKVDVLTQLRDEAGRKYFGNVGQDLMLQFELARFNWRTMRLSLNGKSTSAE